MKGWKDVQKTDEIRKVCEWKRIREVLIVNDDDDDIL